ncbi:hypothetical protein Misp01_47280 [Microtetraspora sp. NBRC 13810]|uniref:DUF1707 SHOCT-like domain-containing protein n=1 Tax=Microtetraspora sp. NBRC 13810 TaxID=3030990 RepID=UPI0024A014EC|nr:DUF1707 domain-containing protein [Microtetraspora sp. NBRC 13810]GLW09599.1 hypothetical protein Misp01_47280 [Microtetraspora sp. NBRC 13810]
MPNHLPEPLVRVSDEDRDRTVSRLQQAFAEGFLTSAELEDRIERALTARSRADLTPAVADLPDDHQVVRLTSTGGHLRRTGDWQVPRLLRAESEYGNVLLDLSGAHIEHPVIDIDLRLAYGSATIVLPPGATVNTDEALTTWGSVSCKLPGRLGRGRLHVRVTGEVAYGHLRIRHPRRWLRIRRR